MMTRCPCRIFARYNRKRKPEPGWAFEVSRRIGPVCLPPVTSGRPTSATASNHQPQILGRSTYPYFGYSDHRIRISSVQLRRIGNHRTPKVVGLSCLAVFGIFSRGSIQEPLLAPSGIQNLEDFTQHRVQLSVAKIRLVARTERSTTQQPTAPLWSNQVARLYPPLQALDLHNRPTTTSDGTSRTIACLTSKETQSNPELNWEQSAMTAPIANRSAHHSRWCNR